MEVITLIKNEKEVGRIKYNFFKGDKQIPSFIELMSISIDEKERRKGYGSELVKKLVKVMKDEKVFCVFTKVTKTNKEFKSFLACNNFKIHSNKELYWTRIEWQI